MFTPNSRMDATTTRTRSKGKRPTKGLAALTMAGSLTMVLAATASPPATALPTPSESPKSAAAPKLKPSGESKTSRRPKASGKSTSSRKLAAAPTPTPTTTEAPTPTPSATATATATSDATVSSTTASTPTRTPHLRLPTLAELASRKCTPGSFFTINSFRPKNFFIPRTQTIDGPGGSVTASVRRQHRVYFEVEFELEKNLEKQREAQVTKDKLLDIFRRLVRLRNNMNPLIAEEHIVEVGHEYTHPITDGMYGHLWYRVFGYRLGFTQWFRVSSCGVHRVTAGVASVPARVEGWKYWETEHPTFQGHRIWK